jgi:threonine dehydratase
MGAQREALLAVEIPEAPGSFLRFCELLGARSVTEFNYRYAMRARRRSSSAGACAGQREREELHRRHRARRASPCAT